MEGHKHIHVRIQRTFSYTYTYTHKYIYMYMYMYMYMYVFMYRYMCVCVSLSLFLRAVPDAVAGCCGCKCDVVVVEEERREETNRTMSQLIPSAVSLRIAETEQLYQAQRMIGGICNVLLTTYSQT